MAHSLTAADRNTHLKVAATALAAVSLVIIVALTARFSESQLGVAGASSATVVKAGSPAIVTTRTGIVVR